MIALVKLKNNSVYRNLLTKVPPASGATTSLLRQERRALGLLWLIIGPESPNKGHSHLYA